MDRRNEQDVPEDRDRKGEMYLMGADSVPDTKYLSNKDVPGAEPGDARHGGLAGDARPGVPPGNPGAGAGMPIWAWIALVLAILVALAFMTGLF